MHITPREIIIEAIPCITLSQRAKAELGQCKNTALATVQTQQLEPAASVGLHQAIYFRGARPTSISYERSTSSQLSKVDQNHLSNLEKKTRNSTHLDPSPPLRIILYPTIYPHFIPIYKFKHRNHGSQVLRRRQLQDVSFSFPQRQPRTP